MLYKVQCSQVVTGVEYICYEVEAESIEEAREFVLQGDGIEVDSDLNISDWSDFTVDNIVLLGNE